MSQVGDRSEPANKKVGQAGWGSNKLTGLDFRLQSSVPRDQTFQFSDTAKASSERSRLLLLGVANDGATGSLGKNSDDGAWTLLESGRLASLAEPVARLAGRSELCRSLASPYPGLSTPPR